MPFLDGVNLVARAIEVAEDEKLWIPYCLKSAIEDMTFEQFKESLKRAAETPKRQAAKKPIKRRTQEEIIADTERINERFRGTKK